MYMYIFVTFNIGLICWLQKFGIYANLHVHSMYLNPFFPPLTFQARVNTSKRHRITTVYKSSARMLQVGFFTGFPAAVPRPSGHSVTASRSSIRPLNW